MLRREKKGPWKGVGIELCTGCPGKASMQTDQKEWVSPVHAGAGELYGQQ